jgi:hypothetical protein
MHLLLAIL